jgi:hypothetical protein
MTANVKKMMFVGEVPWHGVGKQLDAPPTAAKLKRRALQRALALVKN